MCYPSTTMATTASSAKSTVITTTHTGPTTTTTTAAKPTTTTTIRATTTTATTNTGTTTCPMYFLGPNCSLNNQTCATTPDLACHGHGQCQPGANGPGSFTCQCDSGYTGASCEQTASASSSAGPIAGGVVGGLFFLLLLVILIVLFLRRRNTASRPRGKSSMGDETEIPRRQIDLKEVIGASASGTISRAELNVCWFSHR